MLEFKQGQDPYKAMGLGFPTNLKGGDKILCLETIESHFNGNWQKAVAGTHALGGILTKNTIYNVDDSASHIWENQYDFQIHEENLKVSRCFGINKESLTKYFKKV
jgi:hypothetical protein